MKAFHRWTLAMNTITLASAGQLWTAASGFADEYFGSECALGIATILTI